MKASDYNGKPADVKRIQIGQPNCTNPICRYQQLPSFTQNRFPFRPKDDAAVLALPANTQIK